MSPDGKVTTFFLPPNLHFAAYGSATLQKHLLRHLIVEDHSSSLSIHDALKQLTVYWSAQAWEEIAPQSLCKSWNKLLSPIATSVASSSEADTVNTSDESAGFMKNCLKT